MEKLTLKEIAGYLPYKLKMQSPNGFRPNGNESTGTQGIVYLTFDLLADIHNNTFKGEVFKPILYSLEMLTKPIVNNGVDIIPIDELEKNFTHFDFQFTDDFEILLKLKPNIILPNQYFMADDVNRINQMLYEWHFDIHGLIERGLAIDKSTLNSNHI